MNVAAHIPQPYSAPGSREVYFKQLPADQRSKSVINVVCGHFKIEPAFLMQRGRERERVVPRQICMAFMKKYKTEPSLRLIGEVFGMDHSSVIHAEQTVYDLMDSDPDYKREVEMIEGKL